jgi:biotin carboxyl carrier protein
MSHLKSRVGPWSLVWKSTPRGREGIAEVVEKSGKTYEVRWKKDLDGIWIQLPEGMYGFDLRGELDDSGRVVYQVLQRESHREWIGVVALHGDEDLQALARPTQSKATRVRAQMPGKIIRVMVEVGQVVQKDQSLIVMEAMKMENEIRAHQAGKVSHVKVTEGKTVETGADLILLEPN